MTPTHHPSLSLCTVGHITVASGLAWRPFLSPRTIMKEARTMGKAMDMDRVAIRRGRVLQGGFAPRPKGRDKRKLRGIYSLASVVASQCGNDLVAAIAIGDGQFAFVAVSRGGVLPGGDMVGDEALIRDRLRSIYSKLRAEANVQDITVIAPAVWGLGGEERSLADFLDPRKLRNDYRLKSLTFDLTATEIALIAAGVAGLAAFTGGGRWLWQRHQAQKVEAARLAALDEIERQKRLAAQAALAAIHRPWLDTPGVAAVSQACAQSFNHVPLTLGGWAFEQGSCVVAPNGARAQDITRVIYKHHGGPTLIDFQRAARQAGAEGAIIEQGEAATIAFKLPLASASAPAALPPLQGQLDGLIARFQSLPGGLVQWQITPQPAPQPPTNKPDAPVPDWTTYTVHLQSALTPADLLAGIALEGMRITEIVVERKNNTLIWTTKGELYGQ